MATSVDVAAPGGSRTTERSSRTSGRMWIRTYRVGADGQPLGESDPAAEFAPMDPAPLASGSWPPCACPRHLPR